MTTFRIISAFFVQIMTKHKIAVCAHAAEYAKGDSDGINSAIIVVIQRGQT
jgi:hypothetical protein